VKKQNPAYGFIAFLNILPAIIPAKLNKVERVNYAAYGNLG